MNGFPVILARNVVPRAMRITDDVVDPGRQLVKLTIILLFRFLEPRTEVQSADVRSSGRVRLHFLQLCNTAGCAGAGKDLKAKEVAEVAANSWLIDAPPADDSVLDVVPVDSYEFPFAHEEIERAIAVHILVAFGRIGCSFRVSRSGRARGVVSTTGGHGFESGAGALRAIGILGASPAGIWPADTDAGVEQGNKRKERERNQKGGFSKRKQSHANTSAP